MGIKEIKKNDYVKMDRSKKTKATKIEYERVFENYNLPPRDIMVTCSDGRWVRKQWQGVGRFGWDRWSRID